MSKMAEGSDAPSASQPPQPNPFYLSCSSPYAAKLFEKYASGERAPPTWSDQSQTARPVKLDGAAVVGSTMSLFSSMQSNGVKATVLPRGRVKRFGNTMNVDMIRRSPQKG